MKPILRKIFRVVLVLILIPLLYVGGVIGWAWLTDFQPPATQPLAVRGQANTAKIAQDTFHIVTWNIGYGGLGRSADFFFDGGKSVHSPKDSVTAWVKGIGQTVKNFASEGADFVLLQEVDSVGDRSYDINQLAAVSAALPGYAHIFGKNYDVDFVPMPFTNPYGGMVAGVATWSRFQPASATRYAFEGQDKPNFPDYLFFLDRCYVLERFPLPNGKNLCIINTHNSAYGDGPQKKRQMEQLKTTLLQEQAKGNYVVVGGDWNQHPFGYQGVPGFTPDMLTQDNLWVSYTESNYPAAGWQWAWDNTTPTNRVLATPFDPAKTYRSVIDFFLVSPGLKIVSVKNRDMGFAYSDHQPVELTVVVEK